MQGFEYSVQMQIILFFVSCISTAIFYSLITSTILMIYGEKVSFARRAIYIFITGTLMNNIWTYGVYYIGSLNNFSPFVYNLVTVPNPVFAFLFYILGVRILQLSAYKSLRLLSNIYVFIMFTKIFQRFIGYSFFPQEGDQWNYFTDILSLIVCTAIYYILYLLAKKVIIKSQFTIRMTENILKRPLGQEIFLFIAKSFLLYSFLILFPIYVKYDTNAYIMAMLLILLGILVISLVINYIKGLQFDLENKMVHSRTQAEIIDDFRGFKHDFNNIIQTIGGYIAIGDMAKLEKYHKSIIKANEAAKEKNLLNAKYEENPPLISLIMNKLNLANEKQVKLTINISCSLSNMGIDELDLCRAIGNLMDNAIEAAETNDKKWVNLSISEKEREGILLLLSNPTVENVDVGLAVQPGNTSKEGHTGLGINHSRKIIRKYNNCTLHLSCYNNIFYVYLFIAKKIGILPHKTAVEIDNTRDVGVHK